MQTVSYGCANFYANREPNSRPKLLRIPNKGPYRHGLGRAAQLAARNPRLHQPLYSTEGSAESAHAAARGIIFGNVNLGQAPRQDQGRVI